MMLLLTWLIKMFILVSMQFFNNCKCIGKKCIKSIWKVGWYDDDDNQFLFLLDVIEMCNEGLMGNRNIFSFLERNVEFSSKKRSKAIGLIILNSFYRKTVIKGITFLFYKWLEIRIRLNLQQCIDDLMKVLNLFFPIRA
jgi:hypothetical protein